jgi:phospholipid N-methyltransferase
MRRAFDEHRTFLREFRRNFHYTGAIAPSSRYLARALARFVGMGAEPQRVLEVGPGTGAVTRRIIQRLRPDDRLDLVELNESFVARLRERFKVDPEFRPVAERTRVLHQRVEELPEGPTYDLIVSGLPLNNFSAADVRHILATFRLLCRPGGMLSFFEYIGVRPLRSLVSRQTERKRLREVGQVLRELLKGSEIRRECILPNLPPAWVHHVRLPVLPS